MSWQAWLALLGWLVLAPLYLREAWRQRKRLGRHKR